MDAPRKDLLYTQFKQWSSPLAARSKREGFRTCFRLEAPKDNDKPWHLRFLLQAEEDPSLLIKAEDAYKETKAREAGLREEFHSRFLADLGVATRFFPLIDKALAVPKPHSLRLNTSGAYSFLSEVSPLLKECGFGIFAPSFWDMEHRKGSRVGVAIKAVPSDSESGFGLSQIIRFDWRIAVGDETISKEEFERLVKLKIPLVNIRGQWVELQPDTQENLLKYLKTKREMPLSELIQLFLGGEDGEILLSKIEAESWLKELLESLKGDVGLEELAQPRDFIGELRPYQTRGLSWMAYMNRFGLGVCLADDMGLGKTIQFIALLLHQKKQGLTGPSLLACPTSVIGNWERELKRFAPNLKVLLHHGQLKLTGKKLKKAIEDVDVIITSFSLICRDKEDFNNIDFRYMVLDEAQNIKNSYTKQTQAAQFALMRT